MELSLSGSQGRSDMQPSKWVAVSDMDPGEEEKKRTTQRYMTDDVKNKRVAVERMRLRTFLVEYSSDTAEQQQQP